MLGLGLALGLDFGLRFFGFFFGHFGRFFRGDFRGFGSFGGGLGSHAGGVRGQLGVRRLQHVQAPPQGAQLGDLQLARRQARAQALNLAAQLYAV
jgi:hypothetical protein